MDFYMSVSIDFNKVISYSKTHCFQKSKALCATYVKKAFESGGCKYISGNGWNNQKFCKKNGFELIGDFIPIDNNPRKHGDIPMQFPNNYEQKAGDICLIKHGKYGHICYATGSGINDWVSDYFQKFPGQQDGTGPYCYNGDYERIQFWRHITQMGENDEPITEIPSGEISPDTINQNDQSNSSSQIGQTVSSNEITGLGDNVDMGNYSTILGTHMPQK